MTSPPFAQAAFELPLWPQGVPDPVAGGRPERWFTSAPGAPFHYRQVRNVTEPTLIAFLPDPAQATGAAVIVCPGGGHHTLAIDHEGSDVARWLAARGVAAFVLKNRLIPTPDRDEDFETRMQHVMAHTGELEALVAAHLPHLLRDGERAVALVRGHAAEWGLRADCVGMLGFSAGGHLAAMVTLRGAPGQRPDFLAPIYGSMWGPVTAPQHPPPLFLAYSNDDPLGDFVIGANLELYRAWRGAAPVELHAYAQGGHGFGLHAWGLASDHWPEQFRLWLVERLASRLRNG